MKIVRGVLRAEEIESALSFAGSGFEESGTNRRLLDVTRLVESGSWPSVLRLTLCEGTRLFGCYVITYAEDCHKEAHTDGHMTGYRHVRVVACLERAVLGGELRVSGKVVELSPGDCAVFYADEEVHEVTPVVKGRRVVLTVGALVPQG